MGYCHELKVSLSQFSGRFHHPCADARSWSMWWEQSELGNQITGTMRLEQCFCLCLVDTASLTTCVASPFLCLPSPFHACFCLGSHWAEMCHDVSTRWGIYQPSIKVWPVQGLNLGLSPNRAFLKRIKKWGWLGLLQKCSWKLRGCGNGHCFCPVLAHLSMQWCLPVRNRMWWLEKEGGQIQYNTGGLLLLGIFFLPWAAPPWLQIFPL